MKKVLMIVLTSIILIGCDNFEITYSPEEFQEFKNKVSNDIKGKVDNFQIYYDEAVGDIVPEVIAKIKELNLSGTISKQTLESVGDGYVPQRILDGGFTEWYILHSSDGTRYIVYDKNNFIIFKDGE